jgi:hypothetical protein
MSTMEWIGFYVLPAVGPPGPRPIHFLRVVRFPGCHPDGSGSIVMALPGPGPHRR